MLILGLFLIYLLFITLFFVSIIYYSTINTGNINFINLVSIILILNSKYTYDYKFCCNIKYPTDSQTMGRMSH